jgi:hypothetical protein
VASQAETVHKILSGLVRGDGLYEPTVRLTLDMTLAMAVHRGVLVRSSATYHAQVREALGRDSAWSTHHRIATASIGDGEPTPTLHQQAWSAIALYRDTIRLIENALDCKQRNLVAATVEMIDTLERTGL